MADPIVFPVDGISLEVSADPSGNGLPSVQVIYRDPVSGVISRSGLHLQRLNSAGIRGYSVPTQPGEFKLDPSNSKLDIQQS